MFLMQQCSSSWTMFLMFLLQCFSWPQLLQIGPQQPTRSSRLAWNVWTSDLNSFCEFLQIMSSPELAPEWERWKLPVNPNVSQEEDCWRHQELNTKNRDAVVQPRQDIGKYFQTFLDKNDYLFQFFLESIIKWMRMLFLWYLYYLSREGNNCNCNKKASEWGRWT